MKKILIGLLVLGSISVFANSEFERGYYEGKQSCQRELWSCSVIVPWRNGKTEEAVREGSSRAEALSNLLEMNYQVIYDYVRSGKAICKKL